MVVSVCWTKWAKTTIIMQVQNFSLVTRDPSTQRRVAYPAKHQPRRRLVKPCMVPTKIVPMKETLRPINRLLWLTVYCDNPGNNCPKKICSVVDDNDWRFDNLRASQVNNFSSIHSCDAIGYQGSKKWLVSLNSSTASLIFGQLSLLSTICTVIYDTEKIHLANRPFPNCLVPLFQSEALCKTFCTKMSFIFMWMETHFHMKGYAPRLAFKRGTRQLGNGLFNYTNTFRTMYPTIDLPCRDQDCHYFKT